MCAGPDADVSGKGARALDGRTQSALPALVGNPTPPAPPPNPSQNNPDARAGNDPTRARRSPPERSALTDAYSSFRANAISSLPGRARCSPGSTRPRRQSQTSRLGLEEERAASSVQKGGKSGRSPRVDGGSDSDSLTFECPTDTPHKRRRARSPSDTDTDDDVRSPLKRRSGARTLTASQYKPPPRVDETTTEPLKDFGAGHCSMDFASLLNILDDPKDGVSAAADASLSRQNSCSLADDTCMDADVDHLMCDVVSDCLDSHPDRSASRRMEPEPFPSFSVFQPLPAPAFVGSKGLSARAQPFMPPGAVSIGARGLVSTDSTVTAPKFRRLGPPVSRERRNLWALGEVLPCAGEVLSVLQRWRTVQQTIGVPY